MVAVGRPPAGAMRDAIEAFEARAARYWPLDVIEVRAEPARSRPDAGVRRLEAVRLREQARGVVVALDERGRAMTTVQFAHWLSERRVRAEDTTFLIGGAFGLDPPLRAEATLILSVASWTLSHDLARLVLAEQLYRAGTVVRGEPYHKPG